MVWIGESREDETLYCAHGFGPGEVEPERGDGPWLFAHRRRTYNNDEYQKLKDPIGFYTKNPMVIRSVVGCAVIGAYPVLYILSSSFGPAFVTLSLHL